MFQRLLLQDIVRMMVSGGGVLYVCGDARGMAKGVRESLVRILEAEGLPASETFARWTQEKRYIMEVWF